MLLNVLLMHGSVIYMGQWRGRLLHASSSVVIRQVDSPRTYSTVLHRSKSQNETVMLLSIWCAAQDAQQHLPKAAVVTSAHQSASGAAALVLSSAIASDNAAGLVLSSDMASDNAATRSQLCAAASDFSLATKSPFSTHSRQETPLSRRISLSCPTRNRPKSVSGDSFTACRHRRPPWRMPPEQPSQLCIQQETTNFLRCQRKTCEEARPVGQRRSSAPAIKQSQPPAWSPAVYIVLLTNRSQIAVDRINAI